MLRVTAGGSADGKLMAGDRIVAVGGYSTTDYIKVSHIIIYYL